MALQWVTPVGNIGTLYVSIPSTIEVMALNTANNGSTLTYEVINGSLPTGLTLNSNGKITGTAVYSTPSNNNFISQNFNFIVRARSSDGTTPIDGKFVIRLTNTINSDFEWITPAGNLGTVPNGTFYHLPLEVVETIPGVTTTFKFLSGTLPPGMEVVSTGALEGVPTLLNPVAVNQSETFRFSIRATNSLGRVQDRAFYMSITNVYGPIIEPTTVYLGSHFDGSFYEQQLVVNELNPNVAISWSNIGALPPGVTLSSDGLISGYLLPVGGSAGGEISGYDFEEVDSGSGAIIYQQEYDKSAYDFGNTNSRSISYNFTIRAFDGANYDLQDYIINVVSRGDFTADNNFLTVDDTYLTIDSGNVYIPIIKNSSVTTLPFGRTGASYAYKIDGFDFQGDALTYSLTNTVGTFDAMVEGIDNGFDYGGDNETHIGGVGFDSFNPNMSSSTNLPGLILDSTTGWVYGQIADQLEAIKEYTFGVQVSKVKDNVTYTSKPVYLSLTVYGDTNDTIQWITPSDLGTINNGTVSELFVKAVSNEGKPLVYRLVDRANVPIRLPQGLEIVTDTKHDLGLLSGRVTFETFTIDDFTTTFDNDTMSIDQTYTFTVEVSTVTGSATAEREFTLRLNVIDKEPYDNLYLRALPAYDQRQIWNSVISNTEIFPEDLIYRPEDPWFGIPENIEMLFLPGLMPADIDAFANAITQNHYTKTYNFGDIKTAVVLDNLYKVKYEVVYIEVVDPELNSSGNGPALVLDLTNDIANPYVDEIGNTYKIAYPNSGENMIDRLATGVGYYDQSTLPEWMTSNQLSSVTGKFSAPLGFTRAVVLAHTVPGASNLIAYRLRNSGINFNNIEFTADRYFLDDYYTTNFDTTTQKYKEGRETTFDHLINQNIGRLVATVNYGVNVPFSQINGRPVSYIKDNGGLDGIMNFHDGDTLVFAKQENFLNPGPYEGWVRYSDAWVGDNILTDTIEGYDSEGFDVYSIVPGYLEKVQGTATVNERGGVWQINIVNDIVNLTMIQEILPNQRVRVIVGNTYNGAILFYNQILAPGQLVPFYDIYRYQPGQTAKKTTFNGDTTRFFNYRDMNYAPGENDHMVKFPQYGMFK